MIEINMIELIIRFVALSLFMAVMLYYLLKIDFFFIEDNKNKGGHKK